MAAERDEARGDLTSLRDPLAAPTSESSDGTGITEDPAVRRVGIRDLAGLIGRGVQLAWVSAPSELLICLVLQVLGGFGLTMQLVLGGRVIDAVVDDVPGRDLGDLAPELIALGIVTAMVAWSAAAVVERQRVLAALVERQVQDRILDTVSGVRLEAFENHSFHDRLRRATINASERSWQVSIAIVSLLSAAATLVPLAVVLVRIEPLAVPAVLVAYVPLHLATTRNGRAFYEFNFWMTTADRERAYLGGVLLGQSTAKEVRLFGAAPWIRSRYDRLYDRRISELRKLARRRLQRSLIANGWSAAVTIGGVAILVSWALSGRITPADAGIAAVAVQQIGVRMRALGTNAGSLHECSLFLDDVVSFLRMPTESSEATAGPPAPNAFDRLRVDHLSFTYPGTDREVLHDLSLEIGGDEVVALVGVNGSGKTTLAKLLCGLYEPTGGRILWDDTDVGECDPVAVRRNVAAAFQDFVRYELSGHHNIGLGDVDGMDDIDRVHDAARIAGAHDRLASLPNGYDTRLSRAFEDGVDLSIGEWQRVALARAFFRDVPFLVLDEPTASLDPHAERELFEAMRELQRGRAVLLISHRFSSVRAADRIYVLDGGEVLESGTHDELMQRRGRYADMFTLQVAAYVDAPDAGEPAR